MTAFRRRGIGGRVRALAGSTVLLGIGCGGNPSGSSHAASADAPWPYQSGLPPERSSASWPLVWSDEFEGSGLPSANDWGYETGLVRNQEAQYFTANRVENAHLESGMLVIEARKEAFETASYTSASVITLGKREFLYGRIEVRAKIPRGRGTWPAIWLFGVNRGAVGWPQCGEIDIMENVGHDPDTIRCSVHTASSEHSGPTNSVRIPDASTMFHTYALEWSRNRIEVLVDDESVLRVENDRSGSSDTWPFSQPFYLLMNVAIGGSWGGQQGIDDGAFPHKMYVDYVRYYQER